MVPEGVRVKLLYRLMALQRYRPRKNERTLSIAGFFIRRGAAPRRHGELLCSYCSVFAAYGRKVIVIPKESILQDIRTLVESGANHIVFVDADFLSAWKYSRSVVEAMCREFPQLTFEYTTRVDHMLEHPNVVAEFHDLGCTRVTSAFEFPKDEVLALLRKNCTVDDLEQTVRYCHNIGQALNPTFILFNPWVTPDEIEALASDNRHEPRGRVGDREQAATMGPRFRYRLLHDVFRRARIANPIGGQPQCLRCNGLHQVHELRSWCRFVGRLLRRESLLLLIDGSRRQKDAGFSPTVIGNARRPRSGVS